jgi:acyl-coenzyme A synthetase/AMP-(fatty) acid ligase/3-hydroxymyristoyl/3-hydroxydecanoyl-(acyl carrier protein) dehydratase
MTRISQWLTLLPETVIASSLDNQITTAQFRLDVQRLAACITEQKGDKWAVYYLDSYKFLVALCALWQLGKTACIAANDSPSTIEQLGLSVAGFIGDFSTVETLDEHSFSDKHIALTDTALDFVALQIYTSGSTGQPTAITKTISQLELEVATLELQWPTLVSCTVLATVSHQHLYGMVFKLFWPVSCHQSFVSKTCHYIEDIVYQASFFKAICLIASPSHLGRMHMFSDCSSLQGKCQFVVSSAAPLSLEDSQSVSRLLAAPVREIYGSSETGAIAWRIQSVDHQKMVSGESVEIEQLWQALPKVTLSLTHQGTLQCKAGYVEPASGFELSDRAEFVGCGFKLLGRLDSTVKIEGKRVSLRAIEHALLAHPWVKNARVIVRYAKRVESSAVIELSLLGCNQYNALGRKQVIQTLLSCLTASFEKIVQPRKWRFFTYFPYNAQGKLPLSTLEALFENPVPEQELTSDMSDKQLNAKQVELPIIERHFDKEGTSVWSFCLPPDLLYFDGHFADNPILPGVVQVHWAQLYARQKWTINGHFSHLEKVKYQKVLMPNMQVDLLLSMDQVKNKLHFSYVSAQGIHSSGYICFKS